MQCVCKIWSTVLGAFNSHFCFDYTKSSLLSEIEQHSTRVSNTDRFFRSRPLSVCETTYAITGLLDFVKRKGRPLPVTESMKICVPESVLAPSIELGGLEFSAFKSLHQELLFHFCFAHLR